MFCVLPDCAKAPVSCDGSTCATITKSRYGFRHTATISSVGEIHLVDPHRLTEIDSPPWIVFRQRVETSRCSTTHHTRLMTAVICQRWNKVKLLVRIVKEDTAREDGSVQRCVVYSRHVGCSYTPYNTTAVTGIGCQSKRHELTKLLITVKIRQIYVGKVINAAG